MIDYAALQTELQTDPTGIGYASMISAGNDVGLADALNLVRVGINIFRSEIQTWEVIANTVKSEYDALTAGDKQLYQILVSSGMINAQDSRIRAMFASIFGPATTTRDNLAAMAQRNASRAEQLFGEGTSVSHMDVARALRG